MKYIDIIISPDGSDVSMVGHGFKGPVCLKTIDNALKALGGSVSDVTKTAEFYEVERERLRG